MRNSRQLQSEGPVVFAGFELLQALYRIKKIVFLAISGNERTKFVKCSKKAFHAKSSFPRPHFMQGKNISLDLALSVYPVSLKKNRELRKVNCDYSQASGPPNSLELIEIKINDSLSPYVYCSAKSCKM